VRTSLADLPVNGVGFGFAIHADFELVASRQDVSDTHSANHVLLGRIPRLFVHAVLSDPALGEDAFPSYLPDADAIRKDRSSSGRKWHTLASALHRETGAFMTILTEDGQRVKRRHAVLRPAHLSPALVPNSMLVAVTAGEMHFAHPDTVVEMCLQSCLDACPLGVTLDCIRVALERAGKADERAGKAEERASGGGSRAARRIKRGEAAAT
jgi:hypothetical protein